MRTLKSNRIFNAIRFFTNECRHATENGNEMHLIVYIIKLSKSVNQKLCACKIPIAGKDGVCLEWGGYLYA